MKTTNSSEKVIFEIFKRRFKDGSLDNYDSVYQMVKRLSTVAHKFGWGSWTEDIQQDTLIKLSDSNYEGEGSLEGYIRIIMYRLVIQLWHIEKQKLRGEMPMDVPDKTDFEELLQRQLSPIEKELLERCPENLWWYIEVVLEADELLSPRKIAKKTGHTRYNVVQCQQQIRQIWVNMETEQVAKATAGNENLRYK